MFGPKAHKVFPRVTRTAVGDCRGEGFYPASLQTDTAPEYDDKGVDLISVRISMTHIFFSVNFEIILLVNYWI